VLALDEQLLFEVADVTVGLGRLDLEVLEPGLPHDQLVEVDGVAVEVGAVDAGELHGAVHRHAAGAAHAGAVDHDRVEADVGLGARGPGDLDAGPHHRHRADGDDQVGMLGVDDLAQRLGDEARTPVAPVVGAHDELVAVIPEAVLPEHQVLGAEADDAGDPVAGLLVGAQLGEHRGDPQAAAHQHDVADGPDVGGQAEGADEVGEAVTLVVPVAHLLGRLAEGLHDQRDRAPLAVVVGDGPAPSPRAAAP